MNQRQIDELVKFGDDLGVKVTPAVIENAFGAFIPAVHIRDMEFTQSVRAFIYLKQIQMNEFPESHQGLVA